MLLFVWYIISQKVEGMYFPFLIIVSLWLLRAEAEQVSVGGFYEKQFIVLYEPGSCFFLSIWQGGSTPIGC